jgi:type II secretory pathway predicted ATPase ExeA
MEDISWVSAVLTILALFGVYQVGKQRGTATLRTDIKRKLQEIQTRSEQEAEVIAKEAHDALDKVDDEAERIKNADAAGVVDEFNDLFQGDRP